MIDFDTTNGISELSTKFAQIKERLAFDELCRKRQELEKLREDPAFWQDQANSTKVSQEIANLAQTIEKIAAIDAKFGDLSGMLELLAQTDDKDIENEFHLISNQVEQMVHSIEVEAFLSGTFDRSDAILSIHAGQGGSEACDWASMLSRMYMRYFERKDWKFETIEESRTEDSLLKSISFRVHGSFAYGLLRHEAGTHRLVRLSPFNADNLRQTSFCGVEVLPLIPEDSKEVEVKPDELEWQFTRAGGHGGQNVNKVNTAVILKHIPSGIIVECRTERYQEQNKKNALSILKSKLALIEEEKRTTQLTTLKGEHKLAAWGNQIRNYVLHPYHLVKDTRTKVETSNTQAVLDGDLDMFVNSAVREL